ncbi:MAG TPA: zf-HC2 domain-containing protein [Thermoanaerobaculia bacterium]|jgi:anti-sigma factor RsiW
MREQEAHGERVHQRVWELLPWYVNGSLAERERERVETHLAACLRCQEEERVCRRMAGDVVRGGEVAPAPHPVQLQRMLARIEESEREEKESAGGWRLLAPLRSLVQATPRPLRGALVAQAAVILLLVGFLAWSLARPLQPPADYHVLESAPPAPVPTVHLTVMFQPNATEREIRGVLRSVSGKITAGPSAMGAYTVEVPAAGDPAGAVVARLRSEPQVVMFAEPAAGPGEARR